MKRYKALELACVKASKQGEDPDVYEVIYSYKTLDDATFEEFDAMYNYICDWCGVSHDQCTNEDYQLLFDGGYIVKKKEEIESKPKKRLHKKNNNLLTKMYYFCTDILQDQLKIIPQLQLTHAKKYIGKISFESYLAFTYGKESKCTIKLSKWNLIDMVSLLDFEDVFDIIDTIAHELAHIENMTHDKEHEELTNKYTKELIYRFLETKFKDQDLQEVKNIMVGYYINN